MPTVVVASKNPVKLSAAQEGFRLMFPSERFDVVGVTVASGVADQPMDEAETLAGARNRAEAAAAAVAGEYAVGIEGGVAEHDGQMLAFAWIVVRSADGRMGTGRTASFCLPPPVAGLVRTGMELGAADDAVFGTANSKQVNGAIGLLTDDALDRTGIYAHAVVCALMPFKKPELYR